MRHDHTEPNDTRQTTAAWDIEHGFHEHPAYNNIDEALEFGCRLRSPIRINSMEGRRVDPEDVDLEGEFFDRTGKPLTTAQLSILRASISDALNHAWSEALERGTVVTEEQSTVIVNQIKEHFQMPTVKTVTQSSRERALARANELKARIAQFESPTVEEVQFSCAWMENAKGERVLRPDAHLHTGTYDFSKFANAPILKQDRRNFLETRGLCPTCRKERDGVMVEKWENDQVINTPEGEETPIFSPLKFRNPIIDPANPNKEQEMIWWAMQNRQVVYTHCLAAADASMYPEFQRMLDRALACEDAGAWIAAADAITRTGSTFACAHPFVQLQRVVETYELDNPDVEPLPKLFDR